jgi:hypothetical protein
MHPSSISLHRSSIGLQHGSSNLHRSSIDLQHGSSNPHRSSIGLLRSSTDLRRSSIGPRRRYLRHASAVAPPALAVDSVAVLPMGVAAPAAAEIVADGISVTISVTGYSTSKLTRLGKHRSSHNVEVE